MAPMQRPTHPRPVSTLEIVPTKPVLMQVGRLCLPTALVQQALLVRPAGRGSGAEMAGCNSSLSISSSTVEPLLGEQIPYKNLSLRWIRRKTCSLTTTHIHPGRVPLIRIRPLQDP